MLQEKKSIFSNIKYALFLIFSFSFCNLTDANQIIRPRNPKELISDSHYLEQSVDHALRLKGAEVAWANHAAIRRDFPSISHYSNSQIEQWLLDNFAYISQEQIKLDNIRNTPIPFDQNQQPKMIIRPHGWNRAAIIESFDAQEKTIGLVDVKGIGHGKRTSAKIEAQVREFKEVTIKNDTDALNRLRIRDHSDGLMSFGEAVAEVTRQSAVQRIFEMEGLAVLGLETVESYAIIALPFDILKKDGESIPAALYLRQAHTGRRQYLYVPESIYIDHFGGRQQTDLSAAVDFGGVIIKDPRLKDNFGFIEETKDPYATAKEDAQKTKPWIWGHEVAKSWKNGDKQAVYRHVGEMLKPIESVYQASSEVTDYNNHSAKITEYFNRLAPISAIDMNQIAQSIAVWQDTGPAEVLRAFAKTLYHSDPKIVAWAKDKFSRFKPHLDSRTLIEALKSGDLRLRLTALRVLERIHTLSKQGQVPNGFIEVLEIALDDTNDDIKADAVDLLLRYTNDHPIGLRLVIKLSQDSLIDKDLLFKLTSWLSAYFKRHGFDTNAAHHAINATLPKQKLQIEALLKRAFLEKNKNDLLLRLPDQKSIVGLNKIPCTQLLTSKRP